MSISPDKPPIKGTGSADWSAITNKPAAFPPMSHPHPMVDVDGLEEWTQSMEAMIPTKTSELVDDVGFMLESDTIDYQSLTNKPALAPVSLSGAYSDLTGLPTIPQMPTLAGVAYSGQYADLLNTPTFPTLSLVATSGAYADLTGKPDIPVLPTLSLVATSGSYNDLLNKPVYPTLATVATSGSYNDLTNKPTIPTVNYPVTSVNGKTGAVVLLSTDVGAAPVTHSHAISTITGLQAALDSKVSRRQDVYSGVTDSSGLYSVVFPTPFSAPPNIQTQLIGATHNHSVRVTSVTASGFTVAVGIRAGLSVLGLTVLGFDVTATSGIAIDVIATSKTT